MLVLCTNASLMESQFRYLLLLFLRKKRLQVILNGKSSQEYPVNIGAPQGSMIGPTLFLLYVDDDIYLLICIYSDDAAFCSNSPVESRNNV